MTKNTSPLPQILPESLPVANLTIPDLSEDFSGEDFGKASSLEIPDLTDLAEEPPITNTVKAIPRIDLPDAPGDTPRPDPAFPRIPGEQNPDAPTAPSVPGRKQFLSIAAFLLAVFLTASAYLGFRLATDPYDNRILPNVTVAGVPVGGMTRKEARAFLRATTDSTLSQTDMVVSLPHGTIRLSPENTQARLNVRRAVRAAYLHGRRGSKSAQQAAWEASATTVHAVDLRGCLKLSKDYIRRQLSAYAALHETAKTQYSYRMRGQMPSLEEGLFDKNAPCQTLEITLGTPGLGLDMEAIYYSILDAYHRNTFQLTVDAIDASAYPDPVDLQALLHRYHIDPVDAALDMENYCTIPGTYGYTFDMDQAQKLVDSAEFGETISIPMTYLKPKITQDTVYCRQILGQWQTYHTDDADRTENLRLACASLNGKVLKPGQTLSFNETLGPRSEENGYRIAPAYFGTQQTNVRGGGISQVASTLYYCALLSDLEILSRTNQDFAPGYIELGLDASISWNGPDLVFRNSTHFPIKIEAWVEYGYVNMRIWGTIETDYYVQMTHQVIDQEDPGTTYEEHGPEDGYYDGELIQPGVAALIVESYRCKYHRETDQLISREFEARSDYRSADRVVVILTD